MRTAVVLLNLGGPDGPKAVRPFLRNLFNDPAIIGASPLLRRCLAELIAWSRAPAARAIYGRLGGASPLLANTRAQAQALERHLAVRDDDVRTFVAMRHWHPRAGEAAAAAAAWGAERVVLLPLYPQFSTTTTGSALDDWRRAAAAAGLDVPTHAVCCYPTEPGFIVALAELVRTACAEVLGESPPRILFSAHGLPRRIVDRGDPYPWQVGLTAAATVAALGRDGVDHVVCYQSRVGPLEWIGPATADELRRAGRDGMPVVLVPLAFVSEHSETLVELDIEYREVAYRAGVPDYVRVPTVGTRPEFIAGLARLAQAAAMGGATLGGAAGARPCPATLSCCPCRAGA